MSYNNFSYRERSIEEMLNSRIEVTNDFTGLDEALSEKRISYVEWSSEFSRRRHPVPCCIGGSSVGVLFGHNNYKTPRELQLEIAYPYDEAYREKLSEEQEDIFARGHFAEGYVADFGGYFLQNNPELEAEKVIVHPAPQQVYNAAFPNCIGDFDRIIEIVGGPYEGLWLGECKTATYRGKETPSLWRDYFAREDLPAEERIPPSYLDQMDYYLGLLPFLRGGIMMASCGFGGKRENVQIMFERSNERSLKILNEAQKFCEATMKGVNVSDDDVTNPSLLKKSLKKTHGLMDKTLKPVDLSGDPYMQQLMDVQTELRACRSKIRDAKKEKEQKIAEIEETYYLENEEMLTRIEYLEKERDLIKYKLAPALGDGTRGEAVIDEQKIKIHLTAKPSFGGPTKALLKRKYPEVWQEICEYDPNYSVELKVENLNAEEEKNNEEAASNAVVEALLE